MPDLAEFQDLASVAVGKSVSLSPGSLALLRCALSAVENEWSWLNDGADLTPEEKDYVDSVVSLAVFELTQDAQMPDVKPDKVQFWHYQSEVMAGAALIYAFSGSLAHGFYMYQNVAANGDIWESPHFSLGAGSYRVVFMVAKTSVSGITKFYFDGFELGQEDLYSAGGASNQKLAYNVSVADGDDHWFSGQVIGKHASSTGYRVPLTTYWVERL